MLRAAFMADGGESVVRHGYATGEIAIGFADGRVLEYGATADSRIDGNQRAMLELAFANSMAPAEEHLRAAYFIALAELEEGEVDAGRQHLEYFLARYSAEDSWRRSALSQLP